MGNLAGHALEANIVGVDALEANIVGVDALEANIVGVSMLRGADGITPTIGENDNWYLGETDTGKPSRGEAGPQGLPGVYYGTTPPTGDTHPVWIDPDGDHDDGGLLPAVTSADNGKVLRVVSSAWAADDMPTGGTDMGITGATVGQIAKITAVDESGVPTAWSPVDMPDKLPNPNALTFTGAVTGSYDGSAPLSVEIPQGGGGALSGLAIADNYDIELISQVIIDQDNIPTAGITVTQKDDGSPFAYDGLLIWSDAKSSGSYTTFNFNGYTNYPIAMTHGDRNFLNLYITDGVTMSIVNGKDVRYIIKQSHADTGNLFYPDAVFQRVPEKFTSFKIGADGIASVKFYKAWGLTRK